MTLIFFLVLFVIGQFIHDSKADNGINFALFNQNDYQVKFERVELVRHNNELVKDISFKTFKYNRTLAVVNITFTTQANFGNDVTGIVQGYKFMSNEYRNFPIHFGANGCLAIAANIGGLIDGFKKCGNITGCPFRKGTKYHACNWYPNPSKFPPFIPNGEYKFELQVLHASQEIFFTNSYFTVYRPIV